MKFYKLRELGNDFVLFDGRNVENVDWVSLTRRISDRRTGVGADGVLILLRSAIADVRMRFLRADGSEPGPYGSGLRAFARYAFESGAVSGTTFSVETDAGITKPRIILKNGRIDGVRIDLGKPRLESKDIPVGVADRAIDMLLTASDRTFLFTSVRLGTPYTTVFVDKLSEDDVSKYGPLIERDPLFPEGTDVGFVEVLSRERIRLRTWGRGCGRTLSGASSACAAVVACVLNEKTERSLTVEVEYGTLRVEWPESDGRVSLTGPAETVFSGVWNG